MRVKSNILVFILCSFSAAVFTPALAQSQLAVGVRGGGQLWLPATTDAGTEVKGSMGGGGLLDISYAYYGRVGRAFELGASAGIGIGYGVAGIHGKNSAAFTNVDYLGNTMKYTTSATFKLSESFARMDASLMLAMRAGGFVANIGPRLMVPFATKSNLTIEEATIAAHYPKYNVTVTNELITGKLETPYQAPLTSHRSSLTLLMGLEVGYEFPVGNNAIGIQAFADIGLWSNHQSLITNHKLITVSPITASGTPAVVTVGDPNALVSSKRFVDFGLRVYYAFSFNKSRNKNGHATDTKEHHNRYLEYKQK